MHMSTCKNNSAHTLIRLTRKLKQSENVFHNAAKDQVGLEHTLHDIGTCVGNLVR